MSRSRCANLNILNFVDVIVACHLRVREVVRMRSRSLGELVDSSKRCLADWSVLDGSMSPFLIDGRRASLPDGSVSQLLMDGSMPPLLMDGRR